MVSALADVFIIRLARSGKMVGYHLQLVDNIPPDVNTITFLINPAYTMSGSLDGLTGSSATSQRFFRHVPDLRAQYGALYPASYYRLQEAYNLKKQIEAEDARRASYFANFNANLVDETSLSREIGPGDTPTDNTQENTNDSNDKQAEIQARVDDADAQAHASTCFAAWQKKMEDIQIRAGKRNIINTYVWDADGGLHTESQNFASTVEHTIGGSFSLNAALGYEGKFNWTPFCFEITAQATVGLTQTMSKTQSVGKGFELKVDLSGLEHKGITDYNDRPIQPGEKVDRYRFMSFYLEGSNQNFQDFFNYVVDPEWLASNDEEARALRQARGKPNKTWRVLHRVTYVERPALMGFGRDLRKVSTAAQSSENKTLENRLTILEGQLASIIKSLSSLGAIPVANDNALVDKLEEVKTHLLDTSKSLATNDTNLATSINKISQSLTPLGSPQQSMINLAESNKNLETALGEINNRLISLESLPGSNEALAANDATLVSKLDLIDNHLSSLNALTVTSNTLAENDNRLETKLDKISNRLNPLEALPAASNKLIESDNALATKLNQIDRCLQDTSEHLAANDKNLANNDAALTTKLDGIEKYLVASSDNLAANDNNLATSLEQISLSLTSLTSQPGDNKKLAESDAALASKLDEIGKRLTPLECLPAISNTIAENEKILDKKLDQILEGLPPGKVSDDKSKGKH